MLSLLLIILKSLNCSTSHSEEFNISSNKKKNTDISVYNVQSSLINPSDNIDANYGVNLHLKQYKMYSSAQPCTRQRNNSSGVEDFSTPSTVYSFQDNNKEKTTYSHKKIGLCDIKRGFKNNRDLMLFDMSESVSFNNSTSILKKQFEKSNITPKFTTNYEKNDCLQNATHSTSTTNETQTHNIYSIPENHKNIPYLDCGFELSDDIFNKAKLKMSLKRKNTYQELEISNQPLDLSMKTVQEQINLEPEPKKICTHKESSNLMDCLQNEEKTIKYTILLKYSNYIAKIENLLEEFFMQNNSVETDINKLVYGLDLLILPNFSSEIFGEWNIGCTDTLKKVSTTADMLAKFIDFCNINTENKLFSDLKSCLNEDIYTSWTDENIPDFLLNEITSFLKSKESLYLKSICTEFYSFVDLYEDLEIKKDVSLVNAFAVFLLMVKRNSIIIYQLKEILRASKINKRKDLIIDHEKQNSSALLFVFLDNLNFSSTNYIRTNMRTSFLYKCISEQFVSSKKRLFQIQVVSILSNLFFYFIKYNIYSRSTDVLRFNQCWTELHSIYPDLIIEFKKINKHIINLKFNIFAKACKEIILMEIGPKLKTKLIKLNKKIAEKDDIRLKVGTLNVVLNLIYTIFHFKDCKIGKTIDYITHNFKAKG